MKKIIFLFSCVIMAFTAAMTVDVYGDNTSGFESTDFARIATAGFDDPQNNYAFSSTEFEDTVYVGTGRNFLFRIFDPVLQSLPDYEYQIITSPEGDPWSQERAADMGAEIWRHRRGSNWEKVYQSEPVDVSGVPYPPEFNVPDENAWAAQEPGFRSMITFTDASGEEAIYAASAASLVPGRLLLKSNNGTTWEKVATFNPFPGKGIKESDSRSIMVHNNKLYVGPAGLGEAKLYATDNPITTGDGTNWDVMADFTTAGPTGINVAVVSMVSWQGYLYAGTQNDIGGFQLWRSTVQSPVDPTPDDWKLIIDSGAGDLANTRALTMAVFKDALWVGTSMFPLSVEPPYLLPPKGFELIRVDADDTWNLIIGDYFAQKPAEGAPILRMPESGWPGGFGNFLNIYCWSLKEFDGVLYLGTFDMSSFLYVLLEDEDLLEAIGQLVAPSTLEEAITSLQSLGADNLPEPYQQLLGAIGNFDPETVDWSEAWRTFLEGFAGADLWKSNDGVLWEPVTLNGFDNPENYGYRTMVDLNSLYVGTANPFGGLDVFRAAEAGSTDTGGGGGGGGGGGLCSLGPKSASAWMAGDLWLLLAFISGLGLWGTRRRKDAAN